MALQFIMGRAGAGKTYTLIKKMIDKSIELPQKKFVAVVPEQYSMETQKEDKHNEKSQTNVETRKYIENALRDGAVKTTGTDIDKLMPPVSRFGGGNRAAKKKTVIDRLKAYFEKFYGIGGQAKFTEESVEE